MNYVAVRVGGERPRGISSPSSALKVDSLVSFRLTGEGYLEKTGQTAGGIPHPSLLFPVAMGCGTDRSKIFNAFLIRRENMLSAVVALITKFAITGGGLWCVWGAIVLAGGLHEKNGNQIQSGIWQLVGGGMIIAAAALFAQVKI